MLTRCPQCATLYRLTADQLEAAGGKVRCSRCQTIFNAREHLQEVAEDAATATTEEERSERKPNTEALEKRLQNRLDRKQSGGEAAAPLRRPPPRRQGLAWALLFLLILTAAGQYIWLQRESLIHDPQGRRLLQVGCDIFGCELPLRRDLSAFRILSRDMTTHPQIKNGLLFLMVMSNQADFAQPYPLLQLTLHDEQHQQTGQRIFTPAEYLNEKPESELMPPDHAIYIRMELQDPGANVSGFEIKFL